MFLTPLSACKQTNKPKVDEFYSEHGEWDSVRIPFIKPYEALIVNKKYGWCMNLVLFQEGNTMLSHIRSVYIYNDFIFVHTGSTQMTNENVKESWWIISPSRKLEKGFRNHQAYLNYLKILGFKKEPRLHSMDTIAAYYEGHEVMDWDALK